MGGIICPPPPDGVILRPPSSARVKPQKKLVYALRAPLVISTAGASPTGGGGGRGVPTPALLKTGRVDPPRFENEVAKIRYFSDF